jgi:hypothetical protein
MKKLFLLLTAVLMASCTSDLDKKIVATEYGEIIEKIKKSESHYTDQDFKTANKLFDKYLFKSIKNKNLEFDKTYRDILDDAKVKNNEYKKQLANYNKEVDKLRQKFSVNVLSGTAVPLDPNYNVFNNGYEMNVTIENKTSEVITGVKGMTYLYNEKEEKIYSFLVDESFEIASKKPITAKITRVIDPDTDNLFELKSLSFNKIKQAWFPEIIIMENGTRFEAPQKPIQP